MATMGVDPCEPHVGAGLDLAAEINRSWVRRVHPVAVVSAVNHHVHAPRLALTRGAVCNEGVEGLWVVQDDVEGFKGSREGPSLLEFVWGDRHGVKDVVKAARGEELGFCERRYSNAPLCASRLQLTSL